MNLRESLAGSDIEMSVGLRRGSRSWDLAEARGFQVREMFDVISSSQLVLLLIADAAQVALYRRVLDELQPGATLGLSHGFLVAHLDAVGDPFPDDISVVGVCPKGMGPSVRRLYEQGRDIDGAGINASVAIHADHDGRATDRALAWAIGIGAPAIFPTTLDSEYRSDVFGERGILLGAVHGMVEALYRRFTELGDDETLAFERACESLTGGLAPQLSAGGIRSVHDGLEGDDRARFEQAYAATYPAAKAVLEEIYDEVASANELRSVVMATEKLAQRPMPEIEGTGMWRAGAKVRAGRSERRSGVDVDPLTAGAFVGVMVAQVDVLRENGHHWSEVVNESLIEAVDSLIPYMHSRGVAHMVDSCSTTARLGARRWGPRFEAAMHQVAFPALDNGGPAGQSELIGALQSHPLHDAFDTLAELRPPVSIAVD
jgi:ketol-acid reductoisomerase